MFSGPRVPGCKPLQCVARKIENPNSCQIELCFGDGIQAVLENESDVILMTALDKYGFRTNSPMHAMKVADEIIVTWYQLKQ